MIKIRRTIWYSCKTVELIRQNRESKQQGHPKEVEQLAGARGANVDGIHIHSVRLRAYCTPRSNVRWRWTNVNSSS